MESKRKSDFAKIIGTAITAFSFIVVLINYFYNLYHFYTLPTERKICVDNTFLSKISTSGLEDIQLYVLLFIAVHLIRIHIGLNFMSYDESFAKVVADINKEQRIKKNKIELFLRLILLTSLLLLNFIFWKASYIFICCLLIFQALLLFGYNINYWDQLFKQDDEYKANYFILVGDIAFLLVGVLLFLESYLGINKIVICTIGGYIAIFIGELFSQYFRSLKLLMKDLKIQLKEF